MSTEEPERYTLWESLTQEWIKLPCAAMREVGPATQTLGGLLRITFRQTYCQTAKIADAARVPVKTARKHLEILETHGWIANRGRQPTRSGRCRRTNTIAVTAKTKDSIEPYGVLPWWACCSIGGVGRLRWGTKAVLSVVMGRLLRLRAVVEQEENEMDAEERYDDVVTPERFRLPLRLLEERTGLSRQTVIEAKRNLHRLGILEWSGGARRGDGQSLPDLLVPRPDFQIIETPAGPGKVYLDFGNVEGGSKSG